MWQSVVVWPQFAIGTFQPFIHYVRKSDFQTKTFRTEIHDNYNKLWEYNIHALGISTAADTIKIAIFNFLFLQNIYKCHCKVWQQMAF